MKTYTLEYVNGTSQAIEAETDADAVATALEIIGGDAIAAEQWDAAGTTPKGQHIERLLIWESEDAAANDPGANAVAQLTVTRD